jgi:hypothetical protein
MITSERAHLDVQDVRRFADSTEAFGQEDELLAGKIELLDRLAYHFFADTVAIDVGGVPGVKTTVVGAFQEGIDFFL